MKIKKGDSVMVISGSNRGKTGTVGRVLPGAQKVVIEGVNIGTKHLKKTNTRQTGGIEKYPMPIPVSNVNLIRPGTKAKTTRVGYKLSKDGSKKRVARQADNKEIK